jgi:hypothetical protein
MGLFTNTEKKIADAIVGVFNRAENEFQKIEGIVLGDITVGFEQAREAALAANDEVNRLKADLQIALTAARDLHQTAVDAAQAAQAAAEADVARFKAMVVAHTADAATQASQIIAPVSIAAPATTAQ